MEVKDRLSILSALVSVSALGLSIAVFYSNRPRVRHELQTTSLSCTIDVKIRRIVVGVAMVNSGNQPEFVTDASVLVWNPGSPNKEKWDSLVRFGPDPMAQALPVIIRAGETALIQAIGTGDDKVYRVEDLRPASSGRSKEFEIGVGVNVKTSAGNNSNVRFPVGRASLNAEGGATVYSVITPAFRFIDALETSAFSPSLTLGGPPMRIR